MKKNYPKLSIDQLDQSIVVETSNQGVFRKILLFLVFYLFATNTTSAQCNADTPSPFINSTYGNLVATSSISPICICTAFNASTLIDTNLNDFATAVVALNATGSANYKVTDTDTDYLAGTYVGYRIIITKDLSIDEVQSDSLRLKIILNNLLSNAIKYIDESKKEMLISIKTYNSGAFHKIEITDNGIGISEENKEHIFDMFFVINSNKGSGLGLYIVKETLEKLNGSITVLSETNVGSKFIVTIPNLYGN